MRTYKKIICILFSVMISLVFFNGTTLAAESGIVSVANGGMIEIGYGESISGSTMTIPVAVRNLPDLDSPDNGLASFEMGIKWDPSVIHVDSIANDNTLNDNGWNIYQSNIDNEHGSFYFAGLDVDGTFSDANVVFIYIGVTAVGDPGDTSPLRIVDTKFYDKTNNLIPVNPVNGSVIITGDQTIIVTPFDTTITVGDTVQLMAESVIDETNREDITTEAIWSASSDSMVTVYTAGSENPGLIEGISEGQVEIYVDYNDIRGVAHITVIAPVVDEPETDTEEVIDVETPVETVPDEQEPEPVDEMPVDDVEPEQPATTTDQPDTAEVVDPAVPDTDDDAGSGIPVGWIIGGAAVAVAVIGALGYTLFIRGRY